MRRGAGGPRSDRANAATIARWRSAPPPSTTCRCSTGSTGRSRASCGRPCPTSTSTRRWTKCASSSAARESASWPRTADGEALGFVLARRLTWRAGARHRSLRPPAIRDAAVSAEALTRAVVDAYAGDGVEELQIEVSPGNQRARTRVRALGLPRGAHAAGRVAPRARGPAGRRLGDADGASFGSIHVQTDDADAIVRAVEIYVPRSAGSLARLDRDPAAERLRERVRRRLRPRSRRAPSAREGDLRPARGSS